MVEAAEAFRQLSFLLAIAVVSHFAVRRFRQSTLIGEIGIGILLGPSVLGYLGVIQFDETLIKLFAAIGAIFLLFLIGLESDFRAIYTRKNVFVAIGGVLLPLVFGFLTAFYMVPGGNVGQNGTQFMMAMFVGATLTATSTAIAASILLELRLMREQIAQTIMGAAIVDDILGLMVLAIVVGTSRGSLNLVDIALLMVVAVAFIVIAILVGVYFFSRIVVRIQIAGLRVGLKHGGFIIALAIAFLFSFIAELIGLSAIVGAFLAGTMFSSTPLRDDFTEGAGYLGAVFTPIFFISLGLQVRLQDVAAAPSLLLFAIVLGAVAIATKVVGCGIPARLSKLTRNEAVAVGWGMTPRGEVGLIVASTALSAQVVGAGLFSIIVLVIILVSILPAPFFKRSLAAVAKEIRKEAPASGSGTA